MSTRPVMTPAAAAAGGYHDVAYLGGGRCHSFGHQLEAIVGERPRSVLEVGVGSGIVAAALERIGVRVTTLDVEPSLGPDIVGSVDGIPAEDGAWDVAACCQVLEHLPFDRFGPALREIRRVTRRSLVLSLPDVTRPLDLSLRLPRLGFRRFHASIHGLRRRAIPASRLETMGHHWEIGYRDTPLPVVRTVIDVSGWRTERTWRVPELPWHRFFLLHRDAAAGT